MDARNHDAEQQSQQPQAKIEGDMGTSSLTPKTLQAVRNIASLTLQAYRIMVDDGADMEVANDALLLSMRTWALTDESINDDPRAETANFTALACITAAIDYAFEWDTQELPADAEHIALDLIDLRCRIV